MPKDPRLYQIATLLSLLVYGKWQLSFDIELLQALVLVGTALLCQGLATRLWHLPVFDPKSALISSLSLCLLLRTRSLALAATIAAITIFSKFLLRYRDKHVFNPTNFGLAIAILVFDGAWISSGQWGSVTVAAFAFVCAGSVVLYRAERSDITWAFLASYLLLLWGRAWYLGDSWRIPLHQMQSGALLLFAFFMISDPKTTPDSRWGRVAFAAAVALGAYYVQFKLFTPNSLILSLVAWSALVPFIDRLLPARRYQWPGLPAPNPA